MQLKIHSIMKNFYYLLLLFTYSLTAQNDCSSAVEVQLGTYTCEQMTGVLPGISCTVTDVGADYAAWYRFNFTENTGIRITTDLPQNIGKDTRFRIYKGNCTNLVCVIGDDDSGSGYLSTVDFSVEANQDYYLVFDDRWDDEAFDFKIETSTYISDNPISFVMVDRGWGNPEGCTVDMNGDYLDDIVTVVNGNTIRIDYQNEDGSFDSETYNTSNFHVSSWSLTAGDLNGDLKNDLLLGGSSGASILFSDAESDNFTVESSSFYLFSQRTNMVDIDNDGFLDAFICHDVEPNVYVMNDNNENFTWYQGGLGDYPSGGNYGSIWVDYDNDGDQDLFIAKCRGGSDAKYNELHRNDGDGNFTNVSVEANMWDPVQTWSAAWADYDQDGDFDAYIGASTFADGGHKMMINNGDGTFTDQVIGTNMENFNYGGLENVSYDFDNDGWPDIMGDANNGYIFFNNGDMTFSRMTLGFAGGAVGDLDNNGFLDIYKDGKILYNQGNDNNWLKVVTIGTESNTNGIGARIELTSELGTQIREVRSGQGFSHGHTLNTHFGLGQDNNIDQVVVKWPSGIVDTYLNVSINETFFAIEGETLDTQEIAEIPTLGIYPNPTSQKLNFKIGEELSPTAFVYNQAGQEMRLEIKENSISTQQLPGGIYFLKLIDVKGQVYAEKFIVKHE